VSDVPSQALRDAAEEAVRLAELRRQREAVIARVERAKAERERTPHCAGCGLAHSARPCGFAVGPLCTRCAADARAAGRALTLARGRDELRDVLAWRALSGDRGRRVTWTPGLAELVGFRLFAEAEADALEAGTVRPEPASTRFGHLPLKAMRAELAAKTEEPPPGARRSSVTELAEITTVRRRTLIEESRPEPVVVGPFHPDPGSWQPRPDRDGLIPSTLKVDNQHWLKAKAEALWRRVHGDA
jgi:hypothetical protein